MFHLIRFASGFIRNVCVKYFSLWKARNIWFGIFIVHLFYSSFRCKYFIVSSLFLFSVEEWRHKEHRMAINGLRKNRRRVECVPTRNIWISVNARKEDEKGEQKSKIKILSSFTRFQVFCCRVLSDGCVSVSFLGCPIVCCCSFSVLRTSNKIRHTQYNCHEE